MKTVFVLIDHPNLDYLLLPVVEEMLGRGDFNVIACICNWGKQELFCKKNIPFITDPKSFAHFYHLPEPKLFLTASDTMAHFLGRNLAKLCREKHIPSLSVEHAAHSVYENWPTNIIFNSDRIALAGNVEFRKYRELGISAERLVITGCPKYDQYCQLMGDHTSTIPPDTLSHAHQSNNILIAGVNQVFAEKYSPEQWTEVLRSTYNVILQKFPAHTIVVKPHPADPFDNTDILYKDAIDPELRARIRIIDSHGSLPHAILDADFVVSFTPSVMLEALLLRKPAIHFGDHGGKGSATAACLEAGAIFIKPDWPQIAEVLNQSLPDGGKDGLKKIRISGEFIQKFVHRWDGKASHRIVNLIEKMIDQKKIHLQNGVMIKAENAPDIKVSIIIVTYNSAADIQRCIDSIVEHTISPYEVIIIDNCSNDGTRDYLKSLEDAALILNSDNLGFSAGCNQGIKKVKGEYIVLLNPDTLVTSGWDAKLMSHFKDGVAAVGPVSNYVAGMQKYEFYTNQRLRTLDGIEALAKHLYSQNQGQSAETKLLIGFCMMTNRRVIEDVGMLDEALFLGNDDLDFSLRLRDKGYKLLVATDTFIYHKGQASFVSQRTEKAEALLQASTDALYQKLENKYGTGRIPPSQELWGMDWFKPSRTVHTEGQLTSIVILTHNQLQYTKLCIESIFKHTPEPFELVMVDNGSRDGTVEYLESEVRVQNSHIRIKIIKNTANLGFAAGNNQGIAEAKGDYILLLNNDVVVTSGWLARLIARAQQDVDVGIVGPRSNYVAGSQMVREITYDPSSLLGLNEFAQEFAGQHQGRTKSCWSVVGFCMLIKRDVIEKIGGFDRRYGLGNFEDNDFCIRAKLAGFKARIVEDCFIHHFGGKTFIGAKIDYQRSLNRNWEIFKQKWAIAPNTPLNSTYNLSLPKEGFDPAKHYCPLSAAGSLVEPEDEMSSAVWRQAGSQKKTTAKFDENTQDKSSEAKKNMQGGITVNPHEKMYQAIQPLLIGSSHEDAITALKNLVDSFPDFARAHNDLGVLYYKNDDKIKALNHYEQAVQLKPGDIVFKKNLADFYYVEQNRVEEALKLYVDVLAMNPQDVETLLITGHICVALHQFDDAKVFYNRVLEIEPLNADAGQCLEKLQNIGQRESEPITPEEMYQQIQSLMEGNDPQAIIDALEELLRTYPDFALAHNDLGVLHYGAGDKVKALNHYERAALLDSVNITFKKNLADFYYVEQNRVEDALKLYVDVLAINPQDVETLLITGHICVALHQFDDAKVFYNRVVEIEPWNADARQNLDALELKRKAV